MHERVSPKNKLLGLLPRSDLDAIFNLLHPTDLKARRVLHFAREPIHEVFFVETGMVSVMAEVGERKFAEVWMVGCEGLIGVPAILGRSVYSNHKRLVQVSGKALKMGTPDLQRAMAERPAFSALMLGYVDEVLFQTSQIGACNATHSLRHRLARWLCMACISEPDQELAVTHEAISRLLGVRRATVTECLNHLESEKVIETARGRIMIVDHEKLEHASCPCYQLMRSHRERFRAKYRDKFGG